MTCRWRVALWAVFVAALLAALTPAYAQVEKAESETDESAEPEVAFGRSDEPDAPSDDEPIDRPELCPWYNKNTGQVYDPNFGDGEW